MKRSRKKYERPLKPWDKSRIERDKEIMKKYGLRKKMEIWKTEAVLRKYRRMARELAAKKDKEKEKILIDKLVRLGLLGESAKLDDILGLNIENFLDRRLQTVVFKKGLVKSPKHARQAVVYGHVRIEKRKVVYPSYFVSLEEENKIEVDTAQKPMVIVSEG